MKSKLPYIDTPARNEYISAEIRPGEMKVLENDYSTLFTECVLNKSGTQFLLNSGNRLSFKELMKYQPLVVLEDIRVVKIPSSTEEVSEMILQWYRLLSHCSGLELFRSIQSLHFIDQPAPDCIGELKSKYDFFLNDIKTAGVTDPSLATLSVFIENYKDIASSFNILLERLPEFYAKNVLQEKFLPAKADEIWVHLEKQEATADIYIPANTGFIAGRNGDGSDFCYYSTEDIIVGSMKLHSAISIQLKQKYGNYRGKPLVNIVMKKDISESLKAGPVNLFGDGDYIAPGLMIESPMLVLGEGSRAVTLHFYLTEESAVSFKEYAESINAKSNMGDAYSRLVSNTLSLEISTEGGWTTLKNKEIKYVIGETEKYLSLFFRLDNDFPVTVACSEKHGITTCYPALKITINKDAGIYPYSWMRDIYIDRVKIGNEVGEITSVNVCNETGHQSTDSPFYPFGIRAEKGSWMTLGNYETAIKPVTQITLVCKWINLPETGFGEYYKEYKEGITNDSFRIRTEYLKNKEWKKDTTQLLFKTKSNSKMLEPESRIVWSLNNRQTITDKEGCFRNGAGFVRMVLEAPEVGFGHTLYNKLLINSLISRKKNDEIDWLQQPFSPFIDTLELQYQAEEHITAHLRDNKTRLYHINPLAITEYVPVTSMPFSLIDGPESEGYLQLFFSNALGYDTIRIHIEMIASVLEFEKEKIPPLKWFYNYNGEWVRFEDSAVLQATTFIQSGILELRLPWRISSACLDDNNLFRIMVEIPQTDYLNPVIGGIYVNAVHVKAQVSDNDDHFPGTKSIPAKKIKSMKKNIPGITMVSQPWASMGGNEAETLNNMIFRSSNNILCRNRPAGIADYERLVLERFPQIDKVKCFSNCDPKNSGRKGVITLVVMKKDEHGKLMLCTNQLLFDIEAEMKKISSPFVIIDAINPVFEKIFVRCSLSLKPGYSQSLFRNKLNSMINSHIAPWEEKKELPWFGYTISVKKLRINVENMDEVAKIHQFSMVLEMVSTQKLENEDQGKIKLIEFVEKDYGLTASHPWYIQIPKNEHKIYIDSQGIASGQFGIGELEIDDTFIIK